MEQIVIDQKRQTLMIQGAQEIAWVSSTLLKAKMTRQTFKGVLLGSFSRVATYVATIDPYSNKAVKLKLTNRTFDRELEISDHTSHSTPAEHQQEETDLPLV
jgi:hypothetical protein